MFDSLALLQTEVESALGDLDRKFLTPEDVTAAAIEALALRGLQAAQSEYGRVSKHVEFYPASRDAPVNKASDMAVPSYVERRVGHAPNEEWVIVHATHPSALSETEAYRSAWYKDASGYRLQLNYDPTGIWHRLWFYTDPKFAQLLGDPLGLPTRFGFLFTHDTILNVISRVVNRSAQLPESEQLNMGQLKALEVAASHSNAKVAQWEVMWESEKDADKAPRGRNRRPVLGRMGMG